MSMMADMASDAGISRGDVTSPSPHNARAHAARTLLSAHLTLSSGSHRPL